MASDNICETGVSINHGSLNLQGNFFAQTMTMNDVLYLQSGGANLLDGFHLK